MDWRRWKQSDHDSDGDATRRVVSPSTPLGLGSLAGQLLGRALKKAADWWSRARRLLSSSEHLPADGREAVHFLKRQLPQIDSHRQECEAKVAVCTSAVHVARGQLKSASEAVAKVDGELQGDDADRERENQEHTAALLALERSLAEFQREQQSLALFVESEQQALACRVAYNNRARAKCDRSAKRERSLTKKIAETQDPDQRGKLIKAKDAQKRLIVEFRDAVAREARIPVPWCEEQLIGDQRPLPRGALISPIQSPWGPSRIVAVSGRLATIAWEGDVNAAIAAATKLLVAQAPSGRYCKMIKHVAHITLNLPKDYSWTDADAARASRHVILGLGGDPNLQDWMVFLHQQRLELGHSHDEESLHLILSLVDHNGYLLRTPNSSVAAHLARARWDFSAGFDPMRLGVSRLKHRLVLEGYDLLNRGRLVAVRENRVTGEQITIDLQSHAFRQRLALEGCPSDGACGGTWIPKGCEATEVRIRKLLEHLFTAEKE